MSLFATTYLPFDHLASGLTISLFIIEYSMDFASLSTKVRQD